MVADRLDLLRQALMVVLTVRISADVADDRACPDRLADASFTSAAAGLRRHTLSKILLIYDSAVRAVMSEVVNDDLRLRVNDLMRFAQQLRPSTVPPQFTPCLTRRLPPRSVVHATFARPVATF